jgi:tetratricopeptide (TPR) repeat protein
LHVDRHDYQRAFEQAQLVVEIAPEFWLGHCALGLVHMSAGNYAEAIRELQNAPLTHSTFGWRGCAYVRAGQRDKGEELLRQIERARQQTYVSPQPLFTLNLVRSVPRSNAWRQPSRPGTFNSITCNRTRYSTDFDLMCVIRICSAE